MTALMPVRRTPDVTPQSATQPASARTARIHTILLATDLSPVSDDATRQAIDLAALLEARLLVVNVIDQLERVAGRVARIDQLRAEREPALLGVVERARESGVEAAFLLWTGEPGRSIVAAAAAENADLIVVGTRGHTPVAGLLLGSVTQRLLHIAPCPILSVPPRQAT